MDKANETPTSPAPADLAAALDTLRADVARIVRAAGLTTTNGQPDPMPGSMLHGFRQLLGLLDVMRQAVAVHEERLSAVTALLCQVLPPQVVIAAMAQATARAEQVGAAHGLNGSAHRIVTSH